LQQSSLNVLSTRPGWINPSIQIAFTVKGAKKDMEGIVTAVYRKSGLNEHLDYLAVDLVRNLPAHSNIAQNTNRNGPIPILQDDARIVLVGEDHRFGARNLLKQHANLLQQMKKTSS
jgi:hypothetical protein